MNIPSTWLYSGDLSQVVHDAVSCVDDVCSHGIYICSFQPSSCCFQAFISTKALYNILLLLSSRLVGLCVWGWLPLVGQPFPFGIPLEKREKKEGWVSLPGSFTGTPAVIIKTKPWEAGCWGLKFELKYLFWLFLVVIQTKTNDHSYIRKSVMFAST